MKKLLLKSMVVLLFIASQAYAQDRTITGTVIAQDDGGALPGASVKVKGTNLGTQTNINGKFSIIVPTSAKALVVSFTGYASVEIALGRANTYKVELKTDTKALSEVVVTSFGIERSKKSLGYATTTVSAESMNAVQNTNFTNSLEGKLPGVQVSGSGGAFTGASILIRGNVTLTGGNQPIIVIDGLPIDNGGGNQALQTGPQTSNRGIDVNPEDIENVVVLKGAAATVLYGSRAASGAILITTKKGNKRPKGQVEFTSSVTFGSPDRLPDLQNTYGQGNNGLYDKTQQASWGPVISGQTVTNFFGNQETLTAYPDNLKDFFQTAHSYHNDVTFNGGGETSSFRVSYGNDVDTYIIPDNIEKKNNLTVNLRTQLTPKLRLGTSFTYVNNISQRTQQGNSLSSPVFRTFIIPRSYDLESLPYEDATGKQTWFGAQDNPYWSIEHIKFHDERNRIFGNVDLAYDILPWLTADLKIGEDAYGYNSGSLDDIGNKGGGNIGAAATTVGGVLTGQLAARTTDQFFTLTGTKKYGDFNFTLTLGDEYLDTYSTTSAVQGLTLVIPGFENLNNTTTLTASNSTTHTRTEGFFGDFVVDYKNILSVNVKARNDFLSTLPSNANSVFYPAIAGSFNLLEALPDLKSKYLNLIKLRANYGKVGKGPGAYQTTNTYVKAGSADGFGPTILFPFNSQAGYGVNGTAGNAALTPEFTRDLEIGGELGFFNNRLSIDASYYKRHSDHIIFSVPVPAATGINNFVQNAGIIDTKGVELSVSGTPLKYKGGEWDINVNFSHNNSMVTALAPGVTTITLGGFTNPYIGLVAGLPYGQIFGTGYQRDANGNLLISAAGLPLPTANIQTIGNPNPQYTMGISNTVSYKGFSLYALIDIRKGGQQYARNLADIERNGVAANTAEFPRLVDPTAAVPVQTTPYIFPGVYATGANAGQPNTTAVSAQNYWGNSGKYVASEGFVYDTSWIRLREVTLTYSVPAAMLKHTPFGRASIGVYGHNLWLHTPHYLGFDPEQNALGIGNAQGLEENAQLTTKDIGINLRFSL